jgi:hypothetical protein
LQVFLFGELGEQGFRMQDTPPLISLINFCLEMPGLETGGRNSAAAP